MLRDNLVGLIEPMRNSAGADPLALNIQKQASDDRSLCLENPRPEGAESSLTENVTSPFQAEPAHYLLREFVADTNARFGGRLRSAKSVFHFDVQGSVAKSTHAGIPWLRYIRQQAKGRVHFWPFDGWSPTPNRSVVAEAYPALWSRAFPSAGRTPDQQDAHATAEWLRRADGDGSLIRFLCPDLEPRERKTAEIEGWILGVV